MRHRVQTDDEWPSGRRSATTIMDHGVAWVIGMRCVSGLRCAIAIAALATLICVLIVCRSCAKTASRSSSATTAIRTCRPGKQLSKAANDANAIGDALQRIGFTVIRGVNLNRQGMVDRLFEFTQKIAPGDTALLFYAGHGVAIARRQLSAAERRAARQRRRRIARAQHGDRGSRHDCGYPGPQGRASPCWCSTPAATIRSASRA